MGIVFKNNAKTTLASSLSNSATSATVSDGSVFPSLSAGEFFLITFDDGTNNEICKCTARSGNTLTIVRAQESTTARAFSSGDSAEGRVTAGVLEQIQENIAAKSANQTVFNATTAGGATTYNIGTNPGVEANAMVFLNGVLQHHDTLSFSGTNLTFDAAPPNGMALEVIIDNLINLQSSNLTVDSFTAADVSGNPQTDFTLSDTPAAETNLIVFVDGVFQDQDAYTISSNTLTITTGVIAGRGVTVYVINPVNIGTPSDSTVTSAKLSGNITMPGNLIVGSNDVAFDSPTFVVDHTNSRVGMGIASPTVPVDIVGEVKTSSHINIGGNLVKASGDLTLDVGGDIILDADGGEIFLKDGGTTFGELSISGGSDLVVQSSIADKDILFVGTDGSSVITALTLDMSDAGKATFNSGASFGGAVQLNDAQLNIHSSSASAIIGSIGNTANDVNIFSTTTGHNGLRFHVNGILPTDNSGTIIDNDADLGDPSYRFKDLHLGGSAFIATNVGIGTNSPARNLSVNSGSSSGYIQLVNTNSGTGSSDGLQIKLDSAGAEADIINRENGRLAFHTNNSERMRVTGAGKVIIGDSASHVDDLLQIETPASGGGHGIQIRRNDSNGDQGIGRIMFGNNNDTDLTTIQATTDGQADCARLAFFTQPTSGSSTERMRIESEGTVVVSSNSNGSEFKVDATASGANDVGLSTKLPGYSANLYSNFFSSGNNIYFVLGGNYVGYINSAGAYNPSDERLKKDVTDLTGSLDKIKSLRGVNFKWIDESRGTDNRIGLIAQEVEPVIPEVVGDGGLPNAEDGETAMKSVDYSHIVPHLVEAIKELEARVKELEG